MTVPMVTPLTQIKVSSGRFFGTKVFCSTTQFIDDIGEGVTNYRRGVSYFTGWEDRRRRIPDCVKNSIPPSGLCFFVFLRHVVSTTPRVSTRILGDNVDESLFSTQLTYTITGVFVDGVNQGFQEVYSLQFQRVSPFMCHHPLFYSSFSSSSTKGSSIFFLLVIVLPKTPSPFRVLTGTHYRMYGWTNKWWRVVCVEERVETRKRYDNRMESLRSTVGKTMCLSWTGNFVLRRSRRELPRSLSCDTLVLFGEGGGGRRCKSVWYR